MLRIVCVAALVAVVAAGCGGGSRPGISVAHGVPPALAKTWEDQASAIADAASAGDDCRAQQLANSLREEVLAKEHRLPLRLRSPLVTGVTSLAARLTCRTTVIVPTTVMKHEPKPPQHHPPDHHHDHHHHHEGGDHQ